MIDDQAPHKKLAERRRRIALVNMLLEDAGVRLNEHGHFIHPPVHLDEWPDNDHSSRLVFIVQELSEGGCSLFIG
jgi:hypothetical protein